MREGTKKSALRPVTGCAVEVSRRCPLGAVFNCNAQARLTAHSLRIQRRNQKQLAAKSQSKMRVTNLPARCFRSWLCWLRNSRCTKPSGGGNAAGAAHKRELERSRQRRHLPMVGARYDSSATLGSRTSENLLRQLRHCPERILLTQVPHQEAA